MQMFGVSGIKNAEKYRPSYNCGPLKYLPIAYMKRSQPKEREPDEFMPNFDDDEEDNKDEKVPIPIEHYEAPYKSLGQKRTSDEIEKPDVQLQEDTDPDGM